MTTTGNCPECEKYRALLSVIQSPDRRADIIAKQARHVAEKHPDLADENRAGIAAGLWPGKKVRVTE